MSAIATINYARDKLPPWFDWAGKHHLGELDTRLSVFALRSHPPNPAADACQRLPASQYMPGAKQ